MIDIFLYLLALVNLIIISVLIYKKKSDIAIGLAIVEIILVYRIKIGF